MRELDQPALHRLNEGHIAGLNGVLLGAAADKGRQGICLLGEVPQIFTHFLYPRASMAVLRAFSELADIQLDLDELEEQADAMQPALIAIVAKLDRKLNRDESMDQDDDFTPASTEEGLSEEDSQRIEAMFDETGKDRSKAYELKRELDRLEVFKEYEDRFLDLFKKE